MARINFIGIFFFKALLLFFILAIFSLSAYSQASVKVEYPSKKIMINEEFSINITYSNDHLKSVSNFPEISDFIKENTTYNKIKDNYIITQKYRPTKAGEYVLKKYYLSINGIIYQFNDFNITVTNKRKSIKKDTIEARSNMPFTDEPLDAFYQVSCSKKEIFVGEGVKLNVALLINKQNTAEINFIDLQKQIELTVNNIKPEKSWMESIVTPSHIVSDSFRIKNKSYHRYLFYSGIFYPLNSSTLEIPSFPLKILKYKLRKSPNLIERKGYYHILKSNPFAIQVLSLPDHPLKDEVPVGRFHLQELVMTANIETNKEFRYQFIISSKSPYGSIPMPIVKENEIFDIFTPKIYNKTKKERKDSVLYKKIFEYKVVVKKPGSYALETHFNWIYFNNELLTYDTLKPKIIVKVKRGTLEDPFIKESYQSAFYRKMIGEASNNLRSKQKEDRIKIISNIAILLMLVFTVILIFKK